MSLCFWPKMQVTIFIGSASSVLFLTHFCFCLSRAVIISGPYIICWVFCCLIKKFWRHTTPNLFLLCFWQNDRVLNFIDWVSFVLLLTHFCFWLGCVHALCGSWFMFCVVVARLSIFLVMRVKTWCVGKFPGHPGPQIMPACAPLCPAYLFLSLLYNIVPIRIHIHPYTPTCNLYMLIKVHHVCSYSFGVFKFIYLKYSTDIHV